METTEEKKPVEGSEFLKRAAESVLKKQSGSQDIKNTPDDVADEYKKKTRAAQAQHEYVTTIDGLLNPQSLQEMRQRQEQRLEEERRAAQQRTEELEARERQRLQEASEASARQAEEELLKRQTVEKELQAHQHHILMEKLTQLQNSQKPLQEQIQEYIAFAEQMGFHRQAEGPVSLDPKVTLELEKMKLDAAREDRQFQWQMEQDRRKWEIELRKMQVDREIQKEELELKRKREEMWASTPQVLGSAIAKGMMDREQGPEIKSYRIEVEEGKYGEIGCPHCHEPIGVGPTAVSAQCVKCNAQFSVTRVPSSQNMAPPDMASEDELVPQEQEE